MSNPTIEAKRLLGCALKGIDRMEDDMEDNNGDSPEQLRGTTTTPEAKPPRRGPRRRQAIEESVKPRDRSEAGRKAAQARWDNRGKTRDFPAPTVKLSCGVKVKLIFDPPDFVRMHNDAKDWPWMDSLLRMFEAGPSANAISTSTSLVGTPGAT